MRKKSESKKLLRAQERERETSRQIDDFLSSIVVVFISLNSLRFYFSFLVSHSHEIEKLSGKTIKTFKKIKKDKNEKKIMIQIL